MSRLLGAGGLDCCQLPGRRWPRVRQPISGRGAWSPPSPATIQPEMRMMMALIVCIVEGLKETG